MELPTPYPVSVDITKALAGIISDAIDSGAAKSPDLLRLAFQCASTFRTTDHRGGCNGARILNLPQRGWDLNKDLVPAVKPVLDTFHERFDKVSYADLIVLAGTVAAAKMTKTPLLFCPGRSDVHDGPDSYASTRDRVNRFPPALHDKKNILTAKASQLAFDFVKDAARIMGITNSHLTAMHGGVGLGVASRSELDNSYLRHLGAQHGSHAFKQEANIFDMAFLFDPELAALAQNQAASNDLFVNEFIEGWTTLMNADRFEVACDDPRNTVMIDGASQKVEL